MPLLHEPLQNRHGANVFTHPGVLVRDTGSIKVNCDLHGDSEELPKNVDTLMGIKPHR